MNHYPYAIIHPDPNKTQVVRLKRYRGKIIQDCDIYIGRKVMYGGWSLPQSFWHNPFHLKDYNFDRISNLESYRQYVTQRPDMIARLPSLRGKRLGCWCSPNKCHGDILIELLDEYFPLK